MALHFPKERWNDLSRRAVEAAKEFGFSSVESLVQWLVASPLTTEQIELLASHLTVHETYFWREPQVFDALTEHILPELIRSRQGIGRILRIWSAGCSTGEEPYSIAIALRRAIPEIKDWHITILATDINPRMVRRALVGVYGEWSFRNAPQWLKEGYFRQKKSGKYEISPDIRKMVKFGYLNLAEDIYPSPLNNTNAMDVVFCRNVLMYFTTKRAEKVVKCFHQSLVDEGWLIVSSSELSQQMFSGMTSVYYPGAIVYRKSDKEYVRPEIFHITSTAAQNVPFFRSIALAVETPEPQFQLNTDSREQISENTFSSNIEIAESQNVISHEIREEIISENHDEMTPCIDAQTVRELANRGKLTEALAACEVAIAADKLDARLYYLRATILQEQNSEEDAIVSLKHALYLDPDFVLAHFSMGNILMRRGNVRSARRHFKNALDLLNRYRKEDALPESEGLTADRFKEIINATIMVGASA